MTARNPEPGIDPVKSEAVLLYLSKGVHPAPVSNPARVLRRFGEVEGADLVEYVAGLVAESASVPVDWSRDTLAAAGRKVAAAMRERHPELSAEAVEMLANRFTYEWR